MTTELSKTIRQIRRDLGMTQREFASRLNVRRYNLSKWERGITIPPGDIVLRVLACRDGDGQSSE